MIARQMKQSRMDGAGPIPVEAMLELKGKLFTFVALKLRSKSFELLNSRFEKREYSSCMEEQIFYLKLYSMSGFCRD